MWKFYVLKILVKTFIKKDNRNVLTKIVRIEMLYS
ncbi:hypothetical protein C4Z92_08700 [Clostridioides difficile]|uniref:Uncharacterized protein n=1 Tax=Clostridioides difficile (strain 630) TaxID=272563 RepID=F3Y5V0_CLOD6|nr:hypothetical protein [Clostridioides difficile]CCA62858.1 conserved hypothetical protein [Clostridioides difficile 630]CCL69098.1 Conserved hypothetical protein [Clostridioides difficile T3]CCL96402.1 Conserved hypothetical protein [Clostridioides difficile T61]EGT2232213.1 hypothetical protein [Clostridioides difficile]